MSVTTRICRLDENTNDRTHYWNGPAPTEIPTATLEALCPEHDGSCCVRCGEEFDEGIAKAEAWDGVIHADCMKLGEEVA